MAPRHRQTPDRLKQAMASFITNQGTPVERVIDAYEELSAGLRRTQAPADPLVRRAQRLKDELDRHAADQGMDTVIAIALMDEPTVDYWTTRILGLAAEAGQCPETAADDQTPTAR